MAASSPYSSDLSDARWELIEPVLTAWRARRQESALGFGRRPEHDLRAIMNAILYVDSTGIAWRYLPHDYPPWQSVYWYFAAWRDEGIFTELNGLLRRLVRQAEGRNTQASACVIDAQSVKSSANVPLTSQGWTRPRRSSAANAISPADALGLLLAVLVTAASVQDSAAGTRLLDQLSADHPTVAKAWVDGGYRPYFLEHAATLGIDAQIVPRDPTARGFTVLPRRWVIERTFG